MTGKIYLLDASDAVRPMVETLYESESLLQELLAKHPICWLGSRSTEASRVGGCSSAAKWPMRPPRTDRAGGHWITCSWTKTECRRSSR